MTTPAQQPDVIQVRTWCAACHAHARCQLHNNSPPHIIPPIWSNTVVETISRMVYLPAELQIEICGRMAPATFINLACLSPNIDQLWRANSATISKIMFAHELGLESKVFKESRRTWSTCPGGLLWAGQATSPEHYLRLLSLIKEVTSQATDFLVKHFHLGQRVKAHVYYNITLLWLFFATTPACADRIQEPWNYYQFLSATNRYKIDNFLILMAAAILKYFPIPWPANLHQRKIDELITQQIDSLLAKHLALSYIQRGLRRLREQVFAAQIPDLQDAFGPGNFWNLVKYWPRLRLIQFDTRTYTVTLTGTRLHGRLLAAIDPGPNWQPDILFGMNLVKRSPTTRLNWHIITRTTRGRFSFQGYRRYTSPDYAAMPGGLGIAHMFAVAEWEYEQAEDRRNKKKQEEARLSIKRKRGDYDDPEEERILKFSRRAKPRYNDIDWIILRMGRLSLDDTGKEAG